MGLRNVLLLSLGLAIAPVPLLLATPFVGPTQAAGVSGPQAFKIGGSSTVFPIMALAVKKFQARWPTSKVELVESGTSAGFRQFCAGKIAIANASRPINSKELKACSLNGISFIELPIAFDAITVVVHPKNTWAKQISIKELARIWASDAQGKVDRWKEVNDDWPDRALSLCGPGSDSGTYDYFNKSVNGKDDNSRSDYAASEDDAVLVRCVAGNVNALGYFGFGYYSANRDRLRALAIAGASGPVAPTLANVQDGSYVPLSRPLFLYINDKQLSANQALRNFVTMTVANGMGLAQGAGSIPLPHSTYRLVESKLYRHVTGSSFGGDLPVGLSIGEALRRSFDQLKLPQFR